MAENKEKASKILQKMFDISPMEYDTMRLNARRWETTDAGVEDAILKQIYSRDDVQDVLKGKSGTTLRQDSVASMKPVFGRTKVFNAKNVLEAIKDTVPGKDSKQSPEEVLVKLYDENPNYVRNRVRMDPDFGDWGADNLEKLIESSRGYKKKEPDIGMATKVLGTVFAPRSLESWKEGRPASKKDIALDAAENVLMALPLGLGAGLLTKGITRGRKAATAGATVLGAGAVPVTTEALDALAYSPTENLDRSVFQPSDVLMGTTTNITAPYMLSRIGSRAGRWLTSGSTLGKAADNEIAKVGELEKVRSSVDTDAKDIINKWIKAGSFALPDDETVEKVGDRLVYDLAMSYRADPKYKLAAQGSYQFDHGVINEATVAADAAFRKYENDGINLLEKADVIAGFMKAGNSYEESVRMASALGDMANRIPKELYRQVEEAELSKEVAKLNKPSYAGAILGSWGVNKYGNQKNANMGFSAIDALAANLDLSVSDLLDEDREKRSKDARDTYGANAASEALFRLANEGGSEADAYWIDRIATNPEIIRGEGEGGTAEFKNWWNTSGRQLMGNNKLFGGFKK